MYKFKFLILLLLICSTLYSQANHTLKNLISDFSQTPNMEHAQWSLYAKYVDTNEELVNYNSELALAPASGLKLFTSAVCLDALGSDFKFETKIYYDGEIESAVLKGNIYIVGGGDPTLGSDLTPNSIPLDSLYTNWVDRIKKAGISKIEGNIFADELLLESAPIPPYWFWEDIGNYYGASVSALTLNDNLYHLFFKPNNNVGKTAELIRTEPVVEGLTFNNLMKTGKKGSGDNGYVFCAPRQFNATLRGTIPAGVDEFSIKGSIPDPALFAAQYFKKQLEENGIIVTGNSNKLSEKIGYDGNKLILSHQSPPLKDIAYVINKKSFNLYTEMILRMASLINLNDSRLSAGVKLIEKYFEKNNIDHKALNLYDGCGLSRTNTITAKMMTELLGSMTKNDEFDSFYYSMAVAGDLDDFGSFKSWGRGTKLEKNARIKGGYIRGVRSHSGYVKDSNGRLIAFSFIANNFNGSTGPINKTHEKILVELANLK